MKSLFVRTARFFVILFGRASLTTSTAFRRFSFAVEHGSRDDDFIERKYYRMPKKIYSKRSSTDGLSYVFEVRSDMNYVEIKERIAVRLPLMRCKAMIRLQPQKLSSLPCFHCTRLRTENGFFSEKPEIFSMAITSFNCVFYLRKFRISMLAFNFVINVIPFAGWAQIPPYFIISQKEKMGDNKRPL